MAATPLIDIQPGDAMTSNIALESTNEETAVFADGMNVAVDNAGLARYVGAVSIDTVTQRIHWIAQHYLAEGKPQAILFGTTAAWRFKDGAVSLVNSYMTASPQVTAETWGDWILSTNNIDVPFISKGGTFSALAGVNFTKCLQFIRRQPFMLAIRTNAPNMVQWCDESNVEEWVTSPDNRAGDFNIRDVPGSLQGACALGDEIAIYSQESLSIAQFVGGNNVFSITTPLRGIGIYGPKAVCTVGRRNFGIGVQGPFATDGFTFEMIGNDDLRRWIKKDIDESRWHEIITFHNELLQSVEFRWPTIGGTYKGLIFKLDSNKIAPLDLPLNAVAERDVFKHALVAIDNRLAWLKESPTWGEIAFNGFVETKWMDGGAVNYDKLFSILRLDGILTNLKVSCSIQRMDGDGEETNSVIFSLQDAKRLMYPDQEGFRIKLRFEGTSAWHLSRVRVWGEQAGELI